MKRLTRDTAIAGLAGGLLSFEVIFGGGRPTVLTALTSILLSPLVMRIDEARREKSGSLNKSINITKDANEKKSGGEDE